MATVSKTIEVCDRCAFGTEKPATETRVFALEDRGYRLALCTPHAQMFDRELGGWTRLAQDVEIEGTARVKSEYFTAERKEEARRISELRAKAAAEQASRDFAARRAAEIEAELAAAQNPVDTTLDTLAGVLGEALSEEEILARRTIPGALVWQLTSHARERMKQREFSISQVLEAAAQPEARFPSRRGPQLAVHQVGDCQVVVDPQQRKIITVVDRNNREESEPLHPTPQPRFTQPEMRHA